MGAPTLPHRTSRDGLALGEARRSSTRIHSRFILLALFVSSPAAAQAEAPASEASPDGGTPSTGAVPELRLRELPAPEGSLADGRPTPAPAARVPIAGYELAGQRIDPDDQLMALLQSVTPIGEPTTRPAMCAA